MKTLLLSALAPLCACTTVAPRQKFIDRHYADVLETHKKISPEPLAEMSPEKMIFFNDYVKTLEKIGIYDSMASDPKKVMDDYLARIKAAKDKRIEEIKKSKKTYKHDAKDIENAIIHCAVQATEARLPIAAGASGDKFFDGDTQMELLLAMNDFLCACAMDKYAPRFPPQALKDYATYVKSGQMLITKNESYAELTGKTEVKTMNFALYSAAETYKALGGDEARVIDANVLSYFLLAEDEDCLKKVSEIIKNGGKEKAEIKTDEPQNEGVAKK